MAAESLGALVLKGSTELVSTLITSYAKRTLETNSNKLDRLKSNITPHIEATFQKCSVIKTLLNPQTPATFLDIYATQRFSVANKEYDHYAMVDLIRDGNSNIILTGTGGTGKSMFTRYLWLSMFVHSGGRIPLFIELRNLNNLTAENIVSFIHHTISEGPATLTERDYRSYLARGDLIIILDGFDELNQDRKESVQKQILSLSENYRELRLIVTSRPDEGRFASWPSFEVATVLPMHKRDLVELIKKAEFAEDSKSLFLKRITNGDLFEMHNSFLTNPLLASMMLLTFSHNFDIPDRMHLFYEQAFDALYQRHDSYKPGGYKREFKTKLSEDVFKRTLSYFCLITYYDEKFIFSREEVIKYLNSAIALAGVGEDTNSTDLLDDLSGCVCFMIIDGIHYVFSHRSFQEYFAAYCMAYVSTTKFERLVSKFSRRYNDQVISLLSDMNPESLRKLYILPQADRLSNELQLKKRAKSSPKFFQHCGVRFDVFLEQLFKPRSGALKSANIHFSGGGELWDFASLIERLWRKDNPDSSFLTSSLESDDLTTLKLFKVLGVGEDQYLAIEGGDKQFQYALINRRGTGRRGGEISAYFENAEADRLFRKSFMHDFVAGKMKIAEQYIRQQRETQNAVGSAMDDIFGK